MYTKRLFHSLLTGVLLLMFTACGGGGGVGLATEQQALAKIADYVNNGGEAPEVSDYQTLHIEGVTEENIAAVNALIVNLDITAVTDIQKAVDALEKFRTYASSNGTTALPEKADYEALGVTGVTDANLNAVNALIAGKGADEVDSGGEVQTILNGYSSNRYRGKGPYEPQRYPEEGLSDANYVVYFPKDHITPDMPVVLFLEGGGSGPKIDHYRGIMKYLASHGYFVIGGETGEGYDIRHSVHIFESAIDKAKETHGLSMKKLAVMGHSQGGGQAFYTMKYFQDSEHGGYGSDASLVLSIDGWFSFDMYRSDLQALHGDVAFLQMNGIQGTGTDPRIHLTIWNLASQTERVFLTLPENDHGYVAGSFEEILEKTDLIHIVGALCDDTFGGKSDGYASIPDQHKVTFDAVKNALKPEDQYSADCAGTAYNAQSELEVFDIDYCSFSAASAAKKYPATTTLQMRATDDAVPRPETDLPTVDPVYHTRIKMVDKADQGMSSYPKVQNWNADMRLLRIGNRIYDAKSLKETNITKTKTDTKAYNTLCSRVSDYFRWSHKVANKFYVINSDYRFVQGKITGDEVDCSTVLDTFSEYEVVHMGPHEGNIDINDRYVVFVAKKPDDTTFYVILYDMQNRTRVWIKTMPSQHWEWVTRNGSSFWAPSTLDWLSVSPSGKYIVFNNGNGNKDGMYRYDINFENRVKLQYRWSGDGELYSEGGHGDIGYDTDGHEVFVQFISGLGVYSFDLDDPTQLGKELLHSPYGGGHISCRNTRRPGWCYVTANVDSHNNGIKRVFALKLDGTGDENIQNFSQTHINDGYHDTYGGPSSDGTQVIFNSHWGADTVGTFVVEAE